MNNFFLVGRIFAKPGNTRKISRERCNASNYKGRGRTESQRMDYDLSHLISSALKYKSLRRTVNFVQRPSDNFLADDWGFRGEEKDKDLLRKKEELFILNI